MVARRYRSPGGDWPADDQVVLPPRRRDRWPRRRRGAAPARRERPAATRLAGDARRRGPLVHALRTTSGSSGCTSAPPATGASGRRSSRPPSARRWSMRPAPAPPARRRPAAGAPTRSCCGAGAWHSSSTSPSTGCRLPLVCVLIGGVTATDQGSRTDYRIEGRAIVVAAVLALAYFGVLTGRRGRAVGKAVTGLRVVDLHDGGPIGAVRGIGRFVAAVGLLILLRRPCAGRRRLGDVRPRAPDAARQAGGQRRRAVTSRGARPGAERDPAELAPPRRHRRSRGRRAT